MTEGRIAFLGDADSVLGFRALGVETVVPADAEEAVAAFRKLVREQASVIMITEDMLDHLQEQVEETAHMAIPAVVVLPDVRGTQQRGEDTIRSLILKAVGVDLMAEDD